MKTDSATPQERYEKARAKRRNQRRNGTGPTAPAVSGKVEPGAVTLADFYAYMPMHNYIYTPAREPWPAASVNGRIAPIPLFDRNGNPVLNKKGKQVYIPANVWLDENRPVEQMTWAPGLPMTIRDRLVSAGGWIERRGVSCFNLYKPPAIELGDADEAELWITHVYRLYSKADGYHIIRWLAHRRQRPRRRSTMRCCSAACKALAKTRCWSQPSMRLARGTSPKCRRRTCSGRSTASSNQ
jgi:hypothetical protein